MSAACDYIPADGHVTTGDAHELALQRRAGLAEAQPDHPQCSNADEGEEE